MRSLISFFCSRSFLTTRWMLWCLFWINLLGTIYGYMWYWNQMVHTVQVQSIILVVFVPDSPTASLFFTIAIVFLLIDSYRGTKYRAALPRRGSLVSNRSFVRKTIEALAVITSIKYGLWAVSMIFAGAYLGDQLTWQDWMLVTSHLGMAIEAILFMRFFSLSLMPLCMAAVWTLLNDVVDYRFEVFPWLSRLLYDHLLAIQRFTISLSLLSVFIACLPVINRYKQIHRNKV